MQTAIPKPGTLNLNPKPYTLAYIPKDGTCTVKVGFRDLAFRFYIGVVFRVWGFSVTVQGFRVLRFLGFRV